MYFLSLIGYLFSFHFVTLLGVVIGTILFDIHSEANPLSSFLLSSHVYFVGFLIVFPLHFLYWIFIDKGTFYNIKSRILNMITDYMLLVLSTLCTIGTLFMIDTFF